MIGRLDKSGDVSGLASGGTYEKIPEIGILSPELTIAPDNSGTTFLFRPRAIRVQFRERLPTVYC